MLFSGGGPRVSCQLAAGFLAECRQLSVSIFSECCQLAAGFLAEFCQLSEFTELVLI